MAFMWLWDAPQGFHQLQIALCSQPKLAFQGTDAMKGTYNVMPCGPTNGPATFINFTHKICSVWQEEAWRRGVPVARLHIPAGILRIPAFSVPVALFSQESRFLFRHNFFRTSSGNLSVWGLLYV